MTTAPIHGFTDTWNDAGVTFSAVLVDVTDTASAAGSTLLDLQVGSTSQMSVTKAGEVICRGLTSSLNIDLQGNRLVLDADADTYIEASTDDRFDVVVGGVLRLRIDPNTADVFSFDGVSFSPTGAVVGQALGYPNAPDTLEPYTPAGGGDLLAAANETITGDYTFSGALNASGVAITGGSISGITDLAIADGGTGASTKVAARAGLDVARTRVATVAALTAIAKADLTDGEKNYVESYHSDVQGYGGGYFRWDAASTATADDFLIFASDEGGAGRHIRTAYDALSPEMAGAKGDSDGTAGNGTEDIAAFRRLGAVLETNAGGRVICEQAGATYRIYSTASDTADIFTIANVNGFYWDMNGCTLYADRDVRTESVTIFPFQFNDGANVKIFGGKLRTRARTIDQTSDVAGMRWFYFTGTGTNPDIDLDVSDSVEGVFFQRVAGTDPVGDRWSHGKIRIKATRCTYGLALTHSGDNMDFHVEADGCFRSFFGTGIKYPHGVVISKNHRGGDLKLKATNPSTGGDDDPIIGGKIYYYVQPADHAESFLPGINIDITNQGESGAKIEGLEIIAVIDSNSAKPERQALAWNRTDDSDAVDTVATARGHVVRNCRISVSTRNSDASSISGRLVELFDPTYNGNWTNETIDSFTLFNSVIKGAVTNDVLIGLPGHVNGPRLVNVVSDSDLLFSGTHPNPNNTFMAAVNTANIDAVLTVGSTSNQSGISSRQAIGGVAGRYGSSTGVPTFVLESFQGGLDFAGGLNWEDSGSAIFSFQAVADGTLRAYSNGDSSSGTWATEWQAAGHFRPGSDNAIDLGNSGRAWRSVNSYGYSINGAAVLNGLGAAIADLNQTISDPPTQAEVQAISDKVDVILATMRDLKPSIAT